MMFKENAKIISTMLGIEDHGIFTLCVTVDYGGGSCQGVGGYSLDWHDDNLDYRPSDGKAIAFIRKFIEVAGVDMWEDLNGSHVRVIKDCEGLNSKAIGIQNITTDNSLIFKDFWESD